MTHVYRFLFGAAVLSWLTVAGMALHEAHALPWALGIASAGAVAYGIGSGAAALRRGDAAPGKGYRGGPLPEGPIDRPRVSDPRGGRR